MHRRERTPIRMGSVESGENDFDATTWSIRGHRDVLRGSFAGVVRSQNAFAEIEPSSELHERAAALTHCSNGVSRWANSN